MSEINTINLVDNYESESVTKCLDGVSQQLSLENEVKVVSAPLENEVTVVSASLENEVKVIPAPLENEVTVVSTILENEVKVIPAPLENEVTVVSTILENEVKVVPTPLENEVKVVPTLLENEVKVVSAIHIDKYLLFENNEEIKKLVGLLTTNSNCVNDIIRIVELIMADGKIDMNDIPLLISFFKKIISFRSTSEDLLKNISTEKYVTSIKYVLIILTKENIIKIPNQDVFITEISKLLDQLKIVEEVGNSIKNCFSCFR
jgi:hypothetical protein